MLTESVIKAPNLNSCCIIVAVPICMPPDGADFTGKVATVSGWGRLKYGGGVPSVLQEVQVSIVKYPSFISNFMALRHKTLWYS